MDIKEIARYLGYGKELPDERTMEMVNICIKEVEAAAEPKCIRRRFNVHISGDEIFIENLHFTSSDLAKNLNGCDKVILFAATLGIGVDRLLNKSLKLDVAKAAIVQAVAATAIEEYCDKCQRDVEKEVLDEGLYLKPRFSPGYGDFSLKVQKEFLNILAAGRIGITLTEGGIMVPEKSVTAVMGLIKHSERG